MIDVVVYDGKTEIDRIPCNGEQAANAVLRGVRTKIADGYTATTMPHKHHESKCDRECNGHDLESCGECRTDAGMAEDQD